ncbi:MAG TPA: c-type cytochrome [Nitrospirales bacterium]|nr:c-type cytochrome [Nitrospirales bacterium]
MQFPLNNSAHEGKQFTNGEEPMIIPKRQAFRSLSWMAYVPLFAVGIFVLAGCATYSEEEAPAPVQVASTPAPAVVSFDDMHPSIRLAPVAGPLGGELADIPAGDAKRGEALFQKDWGEGVQCLQCHSVFQDGEFIGGETGPALNQVTVRRSKQWLFNWIWDPTEMFPQTGMPVFDWKGDQEIADVIAFLETLKLDFDKDKILTSGKPLEKVGEDLVKAYDCQACHTIGEGDDARGIFGYPDLTYVGSKIRPEWRHAWLENPQKVDPRTFMPSFGFSDKELEAVNAYLTSLKWDRKI